MTLSLSLDESGAHPSEFRILKAGINPTRNGYDLLFDDAAAAAVMAAYEEHGVELMIDLEHLSLDDTAPNYDPDARGWLAIEVRNGELWATGVRWTPDGSRRLDEKTQRYISPAFKKDADGRPTRVLNVALVAMPGLDGITALAAKEQTMASEVNQEALAAALGVDIDPAADPAGFVAAMKKALEGAMSKFGGGESDPGESEAPAPEAMADKKPPAEEMAAAKLVLKLTDTSKLSDAAGRIADWRGIVASHEAEVKKLAEERAAIELTERTELVKRLQARGAETPSTSGLAVGKLCQRLSDEPIASLRERVTQIEAAVPSTSKASASGAGVETLSEREHRLCESLKIDKALYAAQKRAKKAG